MQEVEPAVAISKAQAFIAGCRMLEDSYRGLPWWKRIFYFVRRYPPRYHAQVLLNDLVEYLADTRSPNVISLVNELPFQVTARNSAACARTAGLLIKIIEKTNPNL